MSEQQKTVTGNVTHIFAHRFVVETDKGPVLADMTPHGSEQIALQIGDRATLMGEMKPSELKVSRLTCGGKTVQIEHKKKDDHHHPQVDPAVARQSARKAGFEPIGEPRRKRKHFEVIGRRNGKLCELHIELDGQIRKTKPLHDEHKWADVLRS